MKRIIQLFIICFVALPSCHRKLPEPHFNVAEEINGIPVTWREDITEEQRQAIRDILNDMVFVQGGEFWMGATPDQEEYAFHFEYPAHLVSVSDFYISKYEIENDVAVRFHSPGFHYDTGYENWEYLLQILSEFSGVAFDLPTEAQWEYAARGGIYSSGYILPGSNNISDVWSNTSKRGLSAPNELGLYNMADLNQEWCKDAFALYHTNHMIEYDPCVEVTSKNYGHVVRGGCSWSSGGFNAYTYLRDGTIDWFLDKDSVEPDNLLLTEDCRMLRVSARCTYSKDSSHYHLIGCRPVINLSK